MANKGSTPKTMKALVAYSKDDYRFEPEYPAPECGPDDIIIKTEACGICAGDLKCSHGAEMFWGDDVQPSWVKPPFIPGHEFSGVVAKIGADVTTVKEGDRVSGDPNDMCGECYFCKNAMQHFCTNNVGVGTTVDGGFAEYVAVPVWNLIALPSAVSFEDAAMLEPACVALHAIRQADMSNVRSAVVYGCGTIGTLVLQWLTAMGVENLYAVGTRTEQQDLVAGVAKCIFCNCREKNPVDFIKEQTQDAGVDIVFECVGVNESINNAVSLVRAGGQVVLVGNPAGDIGFDKQTYWKILRQQLKIYGTWNSSFTKEEEDDWHQAVKAIQEGKIRPSAQITQRFSFDRLHDGLEVMRDKAVFTNKVMIGRKVP